MEWSERQVEDKMAYSDDVDLEAQVPYSDSPEFDELSERIASGVFEINSNLVNLQSQLKGLETKKRRDELASVEERAVKLSDRTREKFKELSEDIKRLQSWPESTPAQRFTQQKLSREFSTVLSEFQDVQRDLAERQRSSIVRAKSGLAEEEERRTDEHDHEDEQLLEQEQEQGLSQEEVDHQQALIAERETEIQGIEQGIEELNEIFTDLGTIVTEQGTIVDNIEANVYNIAQSTQDASTQLTKAARSQRNTRGRALCLLIILVIILTVILLATFLG